MRRSRDRSAEIALGIAIAALLAVRSIAPTPVGVWMRLIGSVDAYSSSGMSYQDKRVRMLTIAGKPWGSQDWQERVSAYHVLFLHPTPAIGEEWDRGARQQQYSPLTHSVALGERRYSLHRGNLFVVRVGDDGRMRVTQLRAHLREAPTHPRQVEAAFLHATRGDAEVQRALRDLHGYPSTPRRKCARRALDPTRSL